MNAIEFYTKLSIEIYQHPLSDLRNNGYLTKSNNPLSTLILVIDYDTERMMGGILAFIGNSTGIYSRETVLAMSAIGADNESKILSNILDIADQYGMNYTTIQDDMNECTPGETTSWKQLHGNKWKSAEDQILTIFYETDWDGLYDKMIQYIDNKMPILFPEVRKYKSDFCD